MILDAIHQIHTVGERIVEGVPIPRGHHLADVQLAEGIAQNDLLRCLVQGEAELVEETSHD